ncbi:hypothetical protein BDV06DRAFT_233118 [Aspergillus oleicola]
MAAKGGFLGFSRRRPRRRGLRRWRVPTCAGLLAAIALVIYGPRDIPFLMASSSIAQADFYDGLQKCYDTDSRKARDIRPSSERENPRWNAVSGQQSPVVIQNATPFDGEAFLPDFVDIVFNKGVIQSVVASRLNDPDSLPANARVFNVHGNHITPGLVDMHSHHLELPFPSLVATSDANERPLLGPITPFVRALDGFTPTDPAIELIASGGVTTSLNLPGSANIVGGQAYPVKNFPLPGANAEPAVEELLLESGIPERQRQRYLKMACGENPRRVYSHSRMGLAWLLREKLAEAQELQGRQESWCQAAYDIEASSSFTQRQRASEFLASAGHLPQSFELETFIALLRGEVNLNVHCYTPEDLETMLSVLKEFGVHPNAFHHVLEAWQVPELLRRLEPNITIATFADNALFKAEAYGASLRAPKILNDHGVNVAFKSDHTGEGNYAKFLLDQASIAHSFGLPADKALQSVTSIPAKSIAQGHRVGYVHPGYDADLVIWNDHPLEVGATALDVFIDGRPLLENKNFDVGAPEQVMTEQTVPSMRPSMEADERKSVCASIQGSDGPITFTGIRKAFIDHPGLDKQEEVNLVLVTENNRVSCLGSRTTCLEPYQTDNNITVIPLKNGYITPGLIAFGNNLGIQDIPSEPSTKDGVSGHSGDLLNEAKSVHFAKYGVHLHGKAFDRARIGGVTRAVSPPHGSGVVQGVSVGIRTGPDETILGGGVWREDVALHFVVGQGAKDDDTPTVGSGIEAIRQILQQGSHVGDGSDVYAKAANGSLPVVVQAYNQDDIAQLVLIKRDFPSVNLVIYGGHEAALRQVAQSLAEASIPVILTGNRGAPDTWEKKDTLPGPPLSDIPAKVLLDAGVQVGLAVRGDSKLHGLAREARWAGKFAGLSDKEAIELVSVNIERILGLKGETSGGSDGYRYTGGLVVWEGNPLRGEGSVVVSLTEYAGIGDCWPDDGSF